MKKAYIVDSAIATGLGNSPEENWEKLIAGYSAVDRITHFDTDRIEFHNAACIPDLWNNDCDNHVCNLAERVLKGIQIIPENTFIIWTGVKANIEYIESNQKKNTLFLPSHFRQWVSEFLRIKNTGLELNAACASSTVGIALGSQMISQGECSSVLVCAADIVSRFVHMGFSALRALSPTVCRPFDMKRDGLCLGEGAVALLLTDDETASRYRLKKSAEISGWGISNDANHITGPARDGCGLIMAIETSLKMSKMIPGQVEAFCAHGTGTVYNDGMELTAIESVFGERRFPAFSIKGAIGHTLGAAGGIEAAISMLALQKKTVPPTIGLQEPEHRGRGRVSNQPQTFPGNTILTSNSGFGGINAALMLRAV